MATTTAPSYLDLAAQKRADQLALIPAEWRLSSIPAIESTPNALIYLRSILSARELLLTEETDITVLLRKLSSGELSSLELTTAFAKRAALAHQLTTCCTEIFFEEALATAKRMDDHLAKTGLTVGPLHGLPVSIKDLFSVRGVDTSIGIPSSLAPFFYTTNSWDPANQLENSRLGRPNKQPLYNRQIRRPNPPPPRRNPLRKD
jgi:amidase